MSAKDRAQAAVKKLPISSGDIFVHYKRGGTYEVVALAVKEDTLEPLVVYRALEHDSVWVRTYDNFTEEVDGGDGKVPRFSLLNNSTK